MPVIRWEEPGPEPHREEDGWAHTIAAELRERPGEWAAVMEIEAESAAEARSWLYALSHQRLWVATRWRDDLLTLYACSSKSKPEPSSSSATVYTFRKPDGDGDGETVGESADTRRPTARTLTARATKANVSLRRWLASKVGDLVGRGPT